MPSTTDIKKYVYALKNLKYIHIAIKTNVSTLNINKKYAII